MWYGSTRRGRTARSTSAATTAGRPSGRLFAVSCRRKRSRGAELKLNQGYLEGSEDSSFRCRASFHRSRTHSCRSLTITCASIWIKLTAKIPRLTQHVVHSQSSTMLPGEPLQIRSLIAYSFWVVNRRIFIDRSIIEA